jgi:hypothetical protein
MKSSLTPRKMSVRMKNSGAKEKGTRSILRGQNGERFNCLVSHRWKWRVLWPPLIHQVEPWQLGKRPPLTHCSTNKTDTMDNNAKDEQQPHKDGSCSSRNVRKKVTVHPPLQVELSGGFKKNVP